METLGQASLFQETHQILGQQIIGRGKELKAFLPGSPSSLFSLSWALPWTHPLNQGDRIGDRSYRQTCVGRWVTWGPFDVPLSSWRQLQMAPVWVACLSSPHQLSPLLTPLSLLPLSSQLASSAIQMQGMFSLLDLKRG